MTPTQTDHVECMTNFDKEDVRGEEEEEVILGVVIRRHLDDEVLIEWGLLPLLSASAFVAPSFEFAAVDSEQSITKVSASMTSRRSVKTGSTTDKEATHSPKK